MYHQVSQLQAIKASLVSLLHKHQLWSWGSLGDFTRRRLCIRSIHQMAWLEREMVTLCWEQTIDLKFGWKSLRRCFDLLDQASKLASKLFFLTSHRFVVRADVELLMAGHQWNNSGCRGFNGWQTSWNRFSISDLYLPMFQEIGCN